MPIALRTPRLLLREWRDDDLEPFAAMMSADPEVMAMLPSLADRAASDAWVARMRSHFAEHGFAYWAVEIPGNAPFIGATGLTRVRFPAPFTPAVEIGWRFARAYWGRGYATEAARAALDDGFFRVGVAEIVAFTAIENKRSWRVMERLGMTRNPDDDFDFPGVPEGHPLRRSILYRRRAA
jgi:RimJ/RimL family protein N-acetyltransferase